MKSEIQINIKVTDRKVLTLNRSYILFGKQRKAVGLWNNAIAFATANPKTIGDCQILIYTVDELREFHESGNLKGLADIDQFGRI